MNLGRFFITIYKVCQKLILLQKGHKLTIFSWDSVRARVRHLALAVRDSSSSMRGAKQERPRQSQVPWKLKNKIKGPKRERERDREDRWRPKSMHARLLASEEKEEIRVILTAKLSVKGINV